LVPALQARNRRHIRIERRSRRREDDQRGCEALSIQPLDDVVDVDSLGGRIDEADVRPDATEKRRGDGQRVRRLRGAEDVLAFLTAALPRERDAVDERRIDE